MDLREYCGGRFLNAERFIADVCPRDVDPRRGIVVVIEAMKMLPVYDKKAQGEVMKPAIKLRGILKAICHSDAVFESIRLAIARHLPEDADPYDGAAWIGKPFRLHLEDTVGGKQGLRAAYAPMPKDPRASAFGQEYAEKFEKLAHDVGGSADDFRRWVQRVEPAKAPHIAGDLVDWPKSIGTLVTQWVAERKKDIEQALESRKHQAGPGKGKGQAAKDGDPVTITEDDIPF